jgi:glycopeptide antibiotics resistance protein
MNGTRLSRVLWLLFSLFVVYGATIPFQFTADHELLISHLSRISPNPLRSAVTGRWLSGSDAVQNVLLFVPFGVFGVLSLRRSRSMASAVAIVTALGFALSVMVETIQLFTLDRITSSSDVATNTLGAFLGAAVTRVAAPLGTRVFDWLEEAGFFDNDTFYPLIVAIGVVAVAAWEPFDFTIDVGELAPRVRSLLANPWQFNGLTDEGVAMLQHALFAAALCRWLAQIGSRSTAVTAFGLGVALTFSLEASQLFISSRMPGLEDALVGAAGVAIGTLLWTVGRHSKRHARWIAVIVLGTAAGAAMQMLSPFERAAEPNGVQWLPFLNYYEVTTFATLSHALELMLIYLPLGFCVARWSRPSSRATATVILIVMAIAIPIEYLQRFVAGRYPDVTDPSLSVLGGWCGAWIGQRYRRQDD